MRKGWPHYGLVRPTFLEPLCLRVCFKSLEMIVRKLKLIQTLHGCHGTCVPYALCSRPGGDVAKKTCSFKSCPRTSTRSSPRVAPRCRDNFLRRDVPRNLQSCAKTQKNCAKCCAAAGAMEPATLREELASCVKCRATAGAMEHNKVRPVNRLVPCCTVQLVPSSSRPQETPVIQTVPSVSPS